MGHFHTILAQSGDGSELFYIIAVLILSVAGAIFEKIKQKMAEKADKRSDMSPQLPRDFQEPPARPEQPILRPRAQERIPPPVPSRRTTSPTPPVARPTQPSSPPRPRPPVARPPRRRVEIDLPEIEGPRRAEVTSTMSPREKPVTSAAELIVEVMRRQPQVPREAAPPQSIQHVQHVQHVRTITAPTQVAAQFSGKSFRQMTVADWRRAIVLNEILGPPLAVRQHDESIGSG